MNETSLAWSLPEPGGVRDVRLHFDGELLGKPLAECSTKEIGRHGENIAASYLEASGIEVLERNWRCLYGEVDIIAAQNGTLVMVEVKTRLVRPGGTDVVPEAAVNYRKLARYEKLALIYLSKQTKYDAVRFDVVAIRLLADNEACVRHLLGAYEWDS